jgi:hypothetical protein
MSNPSIPSLPQFADANLISWEQGALAAPKYDNWLMGTGPFGSSRGLDCIGQIAIYANNPTICLGMTQIAIAEQQWQWSFTILSLEDNIRKLTSEMQELREEIRQLCRTRTFVVPLTTLSPGPLHITQHIPVTIEGDGEEFTATFTEANISASGETEADAIANFKESLVSTYAFLESLPANERGPLPARQWEVLKSALTR